VIVSSLSSHFITFPIPPLVWCTVSFILGIVWQAYSLPLFLFSLLWLGLISVTNLLYFKKYLSLQTWLLICFIALSFFGGTWRYQALVNDYHFFQTTFTEKPLSCIGRVVSVEQVSGKRFKTIAIVNTMTLGYGKDIVKAKYLLKFYLLSEVNFDTGDIIYIRQLYIKPSKNNAYERNLLREGIQATVFTPKLDYKILYHPYLSITRFLEHTRKRVSTNTFKKMDKLTAALWSSIFLGNQPRGSPLYDTIKEHCTCWGIVHYLARSGLHVALILLTWSMLLRLFPLPLFIKHSLLILFILLYHLLTWPSISFMRALFTFLAYRMCLLKAFPTYPLALFALVCFGVLLHNPFELFFLDFQLSFSLTFGLTWFNELRLQIQRLDKTIDTLS
jgi:hypothetical protein